MTKDRLPKLIKYQEAVRSKLTDPVPLKHQDRPEQYRDLLLRELQLVSLQIAQLKS